MTRRPNPTRNSISIMRSSFIIAIVLIAAAIGLFFGVTEPQWEVVKELETRNERLDEALTRASDLQQIRDDLISRFNLMGIEDIDRLETMLPDTIDSVRLILDVDTLARANSLSASGFSLETGTDAPVEKATSPTEAAPEASKYSTVTLSFAAEGAYEDFILFMRDIERSLRLIDVVSVELTESEGGGIGRNRNHSYEVELKTYWLQ